MKGPIVFRTTYASERLMEVIAEHARDLPEKSPARAAIRVLIRRWINDGEIVNFTETGIEPRLTRDGALEILSDPAAHVGDLQDFFVIEDNEVDDYAAQMLALMEGAA